jgi:hydroxymethylbilane synthase
VKVKQARKKQKFGSSVLLMTKSSEGMHSMPDNKRTIVVGTRQSALALQQTGHVIADLQAICKRAGLDYQFEIKKIVTKGDQVLDVSLSKVGGKGLFVKEIEQALLDGEIDLAVHSMKDMPAILPEGLIIGAVPQREDARDALITNNGQTFYELAPGSTIGTSSLRRAAQLLAKRPDLNIVSLRGNIDTRLRKLREGEMAAIVLAAAGLHRMGWQAEISEYLQPDICLPAVSQGALGIECRSDDDLVLALLANYNHPTTARCVEAERSFLAAVDGGCQWPIAGYAVVEDGSDEQTAYLQLQALIADPQGSTMYHMQAEGNDAKQLGQQVASSLLAQGAAQLLQRLKG